MSRGRENPWDRSRPKFRRRAQPADAPAAAEATVTDIVSGRLLAYHVLQQHEQTDQFLQELFAAADPQHHLAPGERAAAVDIAAGVVRRRRTLDKLLQAQISRPQHQVETDLWRVLRIGAYQLVFGRTPDHAAVDSTVELCRLLGRERWTKFANGVLRGLGRLLLDEFVSAPSATALPVSQGQYRRMASAVFADPDSQLTEYIADAFSLPVVLAERWVQRMPLPALLAAGFHAVDPPQLTLRVNSLRSSAEQVLALLNASGCDVRQGRLETSLLLSGGQRVERLPGYADGLWSVQDEAAMFAARLLAPRPGERILDLCAAPGGKTCQLAELSNEAALITACDVSAARLQRIRENIQRLQLHNITLQQIQRDGSDLPAGPFDAVLVDVPCSNTGVLSRRPEARWRFHPAELPELVALQTRLLLNACELAGPGGRVVYSTCSLEPEENRGVVQAVLQGLRTWTLVTEQEHLAGQPADGAYQALLQRRG